MILLCLLASLIKTRPMPCVQLVLTGGDGGPAWSPQRFRATRVSPADLRRWGSEGLGPVSGWVTQGSTFQGLNFPHCLSLRLWYLLKAEVKGRVGEKGEKHGRGFGAPGGPGVSVCLGRAHFQQGGRWYRDQPG